MSHLGIADAELKKIKYYRLQMYQKFDISKSNGKTREILAPDLRLKHLQRQLLPLLEQLYRVRNPVHGFVKDKSVVSNARAHLGRKHMLNLDIEQFFPTIKEARVVGVLTSIGVDEEVAEMIGDICCVQAHLPQGAPTSPVLSNMVCFRLDRELLSYAKKTRCIYTRYADDVTLSSYQPMTALFQGLAAHPGNLNPEVLDPELVGIFTGNGFSINASKAHYSDRHSRRMVTGIKVNELLNVDRRFIRSIRAMLHSVEQGGLTEAQAKFTASGNTGDISAHIRGKIEWVRNVKGMADPLVRSLANRFNNCMSSKPIEFEPSSAETQERATWVIEHEDGQGTCFFLEGVGLVTAAHCISGAPAAKVFHPTKTANTFDVTVHQINSAKDLALLSHAIPANQYLNLELAEDPVAVGHAVTAIGYPSWGPGDKLNIRPGNVSTVTVKHGIDLIEVTQKLAQGMSGGPLLNAAGSVTGVIFKGGPEEPRDFAIHRNVLSDWLAEIGT